MEGFFSIFSALFSVIFTVPLFIAMLYFGLGIHSFIIGSRENDRRKTSSGLRAIFISMTVLVVIFIIWAFIWKPFFFWWLWI